MNTEPPVGDDLQRMLVSMKQNVLERATPRPRRRKHHVGIAIGVVGVLLLGAAGGGVALGLIPTTLTADPAPTATRTPEPSVAETPSGAPVVGRPTPEPTPATTPTPTPTPTPTRPAYAATDPSTWTISGSEVGPVALGAPIAGELDDLDGAYTREVEHACPDPEVTNWNRSDSAVLTVVERSGTVWGVAVGRGQDGPTGPTTKEGLGIGSTLTQLRAAYPDLAFVRSDYFPDQDQPNAMWTIERNGFHITFQMGADAQTVGLVWDSAYAEVPYEFCG